MSKVPLAENNVKIATHDSMKSSKPSSASPSKHRRQASSDRKPASASSSLSSSPSTKNRAIALRTANGGSSLSLVESKNTLNIDAKENDVAVEINITTGPNVQVKSINTFQFVLFY